MSVYIDPPKFLQAGESCIVIEFADEISLEANNAVIRTKCYLENQKDIPITECMPTYRSLAVYFDPLSADAATIKKMVTSAIVSNSGYTAANHEVVAIPVCYGGEYGPDIDNVAKHANISVDEVIKRHSSAICHCYMIGFVPGFAYLGGMDESIATPRLAEPRTVINGGSVGIAGKQTGIYPIDSPGGWQLIGRTPLKLFTPDAERPTLIGAGDDVRFMPIDNEKYKTIELQVEAGTYKSVITEVC